MDTFFEQIVAIKKDGKAMASIIGLWLIALILCAVPYMSGITILINLAPFIICGVLFGAYKLTTFFNVEYEYIVTNGTMDVDKIINMSSRKRIISFELSNVSRIEKYNEGMLGSVNKKDIIFACNPDADDVYLLVADRDGKPPYYLVFAPEERLQGAIVKSVPKYIANSAFK